MRLERFKLDRQLAKSDGKAWLGAKASGNNSRKQMKDFLDKIKKNRSH
ncbi:hypothetical protein [Bacillus sp. V5-8f]|nr:hypothetical protein [Bacillus sp. V5-8f]